MFKAIQNGDLPKSLSGVPEGATGFVLSQLVRQLGRPVIHLVSENARVHELCDQMTAWAPDLQVLPFSAWDCLPYDRLSPSRDIVAERIQTLTEMLASNGQNLCVIASAAAWLQKLPPKESLMSYNDGIAVGDNIPRKTFCHSLGEKGYLRTETVREAGEYAVRGSLIDIFPVGEETPIRIDFFGDTVESLRCFDPFSQKSQKNLRQFHLKTASEVVLTPQTIQTFRKNYQNLFGSDNSELYTSISAGRTYPGMEHWLPLFFKSSAALKDYLPTAITTIEHSVDEAVETHHIRLHDYYQTRLQANDNTENPYRPIPPEQFFLPLDTYQARLRHPTTLQITPFYQKDGFDLQGRSGVDFSQARHQKEISLLETVVQHIQTNSKKKPVVLTAATAGACHRLFQALLEYGLTSLKPLDQWPRDPKGISIAPLPLDSGFEVPNFLIVTEQDIYGHQIRQARPSKSKSDTFFKDANDLSLNDLVVHREHGIGQYLGLMTLTVDKKPHDCLCLMYAAGDKLFVPVENIETITRYGNADANAQLDRMGSTAWQARKARVKKRIREVASYLIALAAKRQLDTAPPLVPASGSFDEFSARFPHLETDEQLKAIEETVQDMGQGRPMDRLICGDVGFGKTEVALRAAFVAASSGKQVAVIVPTTLLCRQHYAVFQERFQGFPYRIAQLSRLVKPTEAKRIRQDLADGKIDIIIATHTLLSDKIGFKDLGLLIVDEEQHFGVRQKEKLKRLQSNIHVLTLTATPIPRTLQLALGGVRDLSLITTPPVNRLAVRTFIMTYDGMVLREAILREYARGGQIFYVCPRVSHLDAIQAQLAEMLPEMRVGIAHGKLPIQKLEHVMNDFYDRKLDILLSTNIIESGIDVPTANTLIIHRSDLFGLAQLYQLRGRIGRSKWQGYAYFMIPSRQRLPKNAQKRLEVMQTLDKLGAGFRLASHDLDIRGAGNVVGEEQSGHIKEVGVELYQHLLEEAIVQAKLDQTEGDKPAQTDWSPHIHLGTAVLIPETYVSGLDLRLSLYRRAALLESREEIESFAVELIDRFGPLPLEVENFLELIEVKALCRRANIERLDVGVKGIVVRFHQDFFAQPEALLSYIRRNSNHVKLRPDQRLVFFHQLVDWKDRVKYVKRICQNLINLARKKTAA